MKQPPKKSDTHDERESEESRRLFRRFVDRVAHLSLYSLAMLLPMLAAVGGTALFRPDSQLVSVIVTTTVGMLTAATAMLSYLGRRNRFYSDLEPTGKEIRNRELFDQWKHLEKEFGLGPVFVRSESNVSTDDRKKAVAELKSSLNTTLKGEVVAEIKKDLTAEVIENTHLQTITNVFDNARTRIIREIESLEKRGNLNLVLGSFTTMIGLAILAYSTISWDRTGQVLEEAISAVQKQYPDKIHIEMTPAPKESAYQFILLYLPRFGLVVFVQLLGFFFLRLYRNSLESIKYFQNELTNVEMRYLGLTTSIMSKNEKSLASMVSLICKTERNFLLQKGQSTVEIERIKIDNEKQGDLVAVLQSMVNALATEKKTK